MNSASPFIMHPRRTFMNGESGMHNYFNQGAGVPFFILGTPCPSPETAECALPWNERKGIGMMAILL